MFFEIKHSNYKLFNQKTSSFDHFWNIRREGTNLNSQGSLFYKPRKTMNKLQFQTSIPHFFKKVSDDQSLSKTEHADRLIKIAETSPIGTNKALYDLVSVKISTLN